LILPFWLPPVQIAVDPDRVLNRISSAMYGACLEDVNHEVYGGLYAQRIFGESFEEPAPGANPRNPQPASLASEGVSRMWDRVLTGSANSKYALEEGAFNGKLCQMIEHGGGLGRVGIANRGLNRWGISVLKGHAMEGRVYLRGNAGPVTVALQSADGSRVYASQQLSAGKSWGKAAFRLKPNSTDPNARFALWIDRPGQIWVDQAVLMDAREDRFANLPVRKDIADELVGSGISFLRYGGTMINVPGYRWKNMIGDPDLRPPYTGNWYPASTNGFGIFDFLRFCEKAKVGSAFTLNVEETPEDAADLADYLTAPTTNSWGRRRAQDGHPASFKVDYIEIGNEEGIGNPDPPAMAYYAKRFRLLAQAIHGRNPALKLVCGAWWVPDAPQMKTVFDAIDGVAAAWDFHFWCDEPNAGIAVDGELDRAQQLFKNWDPQSSLKVVVFEENGNRHDMQRALGHASTLNATRRHGDFVLVDCAANALQPWRQNDNGWDQGGVFFTPDHAWMMPPAYVRQMLERNHLPLRVAVTGDLDVLATRSEDGRMLSLTVVNPTDQPRNARISLGGFRARSAEVQTISGELTATIPSLKSYRIRPADSGALEVLLPPHSVTSVKASSFTPKG
jgi:alpha-L-arabinofuranosidase